MSEWIYLSVLAFLVIGLIGLLLAVKRALDMEQTMLCLITSPPLKKFEVCYDTVSGGDPITMPVERTRNHMNVEASDYDCAILSAKLWLIGRMLRENGAPKCRYDKFDAVEIPAKT